MSRTEKAVRGHSFPSLNSSKGLFPKTQNYIISAEIAASLRSQSSLHNMPLTCKFTVARKIKRIREFFKRADKIWQDHGMLVPRYKQSIPNDTSSILKQFHVLFASSIQYQLMSAKMLSQINHFLKLLWQPQYSQQSCLVHLSAIQSRKKASSTTRLSG